MLEDDYNDCLSKAIRGHGCSVMQLAHLAGINEKRISNCLAGTEDASVIHSIAPHLQLNANKLIALKHYQPTTPELPALTRVISPFGHLGVNAYLLQLDEQSIVFDTGTDSTELLSFTPQPSHLFITHGHPDHTAGIVEFDMSQKHFPEELQHGQIIQLEDIQIKVLDVSGHFTPARAYFITGTPYPICIVGDAIFAGSVGKCLNSELYTTALANIRDHILSLPENTILCPGHGPMTTVAQERANNPFF
ncbi:MBL fold metallo-hydrolase [Rubritalea tangerina]|uniref:MBL fold metallo-hydrolase n=1 Tax=Rubritalea tangerina TaxID=430798 RepID=A0ABW4Z746_9BACT